ncbi:unnamed protein product [Agarophyton chilense]|eukprot:gb/GEZJ01002474.1/.p1 GENE.gb/GEZJ01002474.1/~~gb/GEZJ01002474.1/.p1  ORF type:complete len:1084 (-),score=214.01 gb/GEZJ01002474.1/:1416-4628(-)
MADDVQSLARALAATLSNSAADRAAAESLLAHCAPHPDHAASLLRLSATSDPVVAPAAALRLKNLVRSNRQNNVLHEAARQRLRDNLLDALAVVRATNIEGVLAETTRWLIVTDFPSKWPSLYSSIGDYLSSGDSARVHAALIALRQLVKCYEFKSRDPNKLLASDPNDVGLLHPRQPLETIAAGLFPTLFALYSHLDSLVAKPPVPHDDRRNACLAQRLIVKVFWSCSHFMIPPILAEPNVFDNWMNVFFETLRRPSLHPYVQDPDDLLYEPESKTKKWISQIILKFLKRYGSPNRIPLDEPWAKKVAQNYRDNHSEKATKVMLEVLFSKSNGCQVSKRVAHSALDFVEEAIEIASLWAIVYPHVSNLLTGVVFSYLCFSDADEEVWMTDPSEYVRKQYDFTDDFTSPRIAASNLLSKMADLRSKKTVLPFLQYLHDSVLNPYLAAAPNSPQRISLSRQKVGAFASLAAVKGKLMSKPELSSTFLMILKKHVHPDLQSEFGFLRSEAAWLLGQVASCDWKEFGGELGEASLRGCVALLSDSELPVQAAAAGALQYLIDQDGPGELIRTFAPQLMQRLLSLMDIMTDSYLSLIPSLDKLICRYPDEVMPLAHPVLQRLIAAFQHSAQSILAEGDDEDDELAFTAAQVLYLISSVLSSIGEWCQPKLEEKKELLVSVEKELHPLLERMFQENHQVFIEELLDVLGALIVQLGEHEIELTPFLRSMIGKMVKAFDDWAGDYIEQMMDAIEGFLMYDMPAIAQMPHGINTFVHIARNLWSTAYEDGDAVFGSMIAEHLLLNLDKMKPRPTEVLRGVAIEIALRAGERCVRSRDDEINLPQRLVSVVMLCVYIDAEHVLKALSVQSTLQLIGSQTGKLQLFERIHSKKAVILGLSAMLCSNDLRNDQKAQLLHIAVCLQQMIDTQRVTAAKNAANAGSNLAALSKETNGFGYHSTSDGSGSDLDDDQDATNVLDETPEPYNQAIEKLAAETGFSVAQLHELGASNGALDVGLLELDDGHDRDDEGGYRANPLDDINEGEYFISKVKQSNFESWWGKVSEEDRSWMEELAKRLQS